MSFKLSMLMMSIISMCWWRKNIITMLLSMEFLLISLYYFISQLITTISLSSFLIMLVMMVSGSSLGLSLLISLSQTHNSSSTTSINMFTFAKTSFNLSL
uniref:NADH dehydrogenase subunit 4L n=1 Tax=Ebrechtella tricuspidata TaxID=1112414 RepID=A0A1U7AFQ9_9ARAC|nr:NADH dehydrogenase subunit 4L [Ebrechtella tricuspidata]